MCPPTTLAENQGTGGAANETGSRDGSIGPRSWLPASLCLFHGDYGPPDPAFAGFALSGAGHSWNVEPRLLKEARNIGEAEAIVRHVVRGESVSWCRSGYGWVEQDAITWFYIAALVFVVLPYMALKLKAWASAHAFRAFRLPDHS